MRCAYQKEVAAYHNRSGQANLPARYCPDCDLRWKLFYGEFKDGQINTAGRVTSDCLGTSGVWFCCGSKKDVPKHCDCLKVGHYCGVYVWVLPEGRDELAKLTLAILDYAVNQPAYSLTKEVTLNLDAKGNLVKANEAVRTIKATIPVDTSSFALLKNEIPDRAKMDLNPAIQKRIDEAIPPPPETFQNSLPPDFQFLNQRLQQLNPSR